MLKTDERSKLLQILVNMPTLSSRQGREALITIANLGELRPHLELSGSSFEVMTNLVAYLENYGRITYDQYALGRLLGAIKDMVGIDSANFLTKIIEKYHLLNPAEEKPAITEWDKPVNSAEVLEKIIGENTLRPIAFLKLALAASRPVAFIKISAGDGWMGTGFLISKNLLLTNHHVIYDKALLPHCIFRFNFQCDIHDNLENYQEYRTKPNGLFRVNQSYDYALVELDGDPGLEWGSLTLSARLPKAGKRVYIIQHPEGEPKQITFQNNFLKYVDDKVLQYVTSTKNGSSGSPVLNDRWEVVGLHHAGGNLPEGTNGPVYYRNEGITISAILAGLPAEVRSQLTIMND